MCSNKQGTIPANYCGSGVVLCCVSRICILSPAPPRTPTRYCRRGTKLWVSMLAMVPTTVYRGSWFPSIAQSGCTWLGHFIVWHSDCREGFGVDPRGIGWVMLSVVRRNAKLPLTMDGVKVMFVGVYYYIILLLVVCLSYFFKSVIRWFE